MSLRTRMRTQHRTKGRLYDGMRAGGWIDYRAARPVTGGHLGERREILLAIAYTIGAARLESTAGQWHVCGRNAALDGVKRTPAVGLQRGHGLQKPAGVGVSGHAKDVGLAA